jgi:hypothetical protein
VFAALCSVSIQAYAYKLKAIKVGLMKKYTFILLLILLASCSKNSFESCVEFYEDEAKRTYPQNWRARADGMIQMECNVSG